MLDWESAIKTVPEANGVIDYAERRIQAGKYVLIATAGEPGSGKSYADLRLAELLAERLDSHFSINNVVDSLRAFVKVVRNSSPRDIVMIEEISVLFGGRRAMAADNVDVLKVLDTCRKKQLVIITNCPSLRQTDSGIRFHVSIYLEVIGINRSLKICKFKPFRYQVNIRSGKAYLHRFRNKEGFDIGLGYCNKPSEDLCVEYEKKKGNFLDELYFELEAKHEALAKKNLKSLEKAQGSLTIKDKLSDREQDVFNLMYLEGLNNKETAERLGISAPRITRINANIKKKISITKEIGQINDKAQGEATTT